MLGLYINSNMDWKKQVFQQMLQVGLIKRQVAEVYNAMPRDLQQTMLSSPGRSALLHALSTEIKANYVMSRITL
jgi:hypothetical protein